MGTLDARVAERLAEFERARGLVRPTARGRQGQQPGSLAAFLGEASSSGPGSESAAVDPTDDEVEYLLAVVPFVREYYGDDDDRQPGQQPGGQPGNPAAAPKPPHRALHRSLAGAVAVTRAKSRKSILQRYRLEVEGEVTAENVRALADHLGVRREEDDYGCAACGSSMQETREAMAVCVACGWTRVIQDMGLKSLPYEDQFDRHVTTTFAYKRLNHFCEWLNSIQAKENTEIPAEVIEAVRAEFKKIRATFRADITPLKVREFLKKLRLHKYYEHQMAITIALNGMPAPRLSDALEEELKEMFGMVQAPFDRHRPPDRKNFLSYAYVLHKFCELLGEDEMCQYCTLLKCPEKLYKQDVIWKKICEDLQWEFIPSV